jgi:hypothetical protein
MPWVVVAKDKKGFAFEPSGRPFVPWGFNYDHDAKGRLIEDYWDDGWPTVTAAGATRSFQRGLVRGGRQDPGSAPVGLGTSGVVTRR